MKHSHVRIVLFVWCFATAWTSMNAYSKNVAHATGGIIISSLGQQYTQNFDSLGMEGTKAWQNDVTLTGWYTNKTQYSSDTGVSSASSIYSYGNTSDRALGSVNNDSEPTYYGLLFSNNTTIAINAFDIQYTGEQWRRSGSNTAQKLRFQYQIGTNLSLLSGIWLDASSLDFTSPNSNGAAASLDGNASINRTMMSETILNLAINLPTGQSIMFRWMDMNDSGSDHGFAIDDVVVTPRNTLLTPWMNSSMTVDSTVANAGSAITYTIKISGADSGIYTISDTIPACMTIMEAPNMTINGQTVTANGTLLSGNNATYTIKTLINDTCIGTIKNTALVGNGVINQELTAPLITVKHMRYLSFIITDN